MCRNIDDVDKTMDEINEQTENMKQIQDALSAPIGAAADFDEVVISSLIFIFIIFGYHIFKFIPKFVPSSWICICLFSYSFFHAWIAISIKLLKSCTFLALQDELEAELEELEGAELEEQLLQPATTAPAAPVQVPAGRQPARPVPQRRTAEEDELAALQAEMAL